MPSAEGPSTACLLDPYALDNPIQHNSVAIGHPMNGPYSTGIAWNWRMAQTPLVPSIVGHGLRRMPHTFGAVHRCKFNTVHLSGRRDVDLLGTQCQPEDAPDHLGSPPADVSADSHRRKTPMIWIGGDTRRSRV